MREQERRRRSPDLAAESKGNNKKGAADDGDEGEGEDAGEEQAGPALQSEDSSSPTPPAAKRPRKGKEPVKEPTTPAKSKLPRSKAAGPATGSSKSKRTRTRSRPTINVPPPPEPVLHQEPVIDPQLEEYDEVIARARYPEMGMRHGDYTVPFPESGQMQAVSGWEPEIDLDALTRAYIQDHE
jgi:hypothetical protein